NDSWSGSNPARPSITSRTPASLLRQSMTPQPWNTARPPDVSAIMGSAGRSPRLVQTPGRLLDVSVLPNLDDSAYTASFSPQRTGIFTTFDSPSFTEDITLSAVMMREEDPGEAATMSLYQEFLKSFQKLPSSAVFDLVEEYENMCNEQVSLLKKIVNRVTPGQQKFSKTASVLWLLRQEMVTWRLIASLYRFVLSFSPWFTSMTWLIMQINLGN
ncbi:hypothetical protein GDO81_018907, partial [Engystomops pustulosus]